MTNVAALQVLLDGGVTDERVLFAALTDDQVCPDCSGRGVEGLERCSTCKGRSAHRLGSKHERQEGQHG